VAYYFTGDSGMGPTRVYRDQGREGEKIWAFPILHLGLQASFEEMDMESVSQSEVRHWLMNVADFTSRLHLIRLVYSHPIGATHYLDALQEWCRHARDLQADRRFRWYTMSQVANFLNARQEVTWEMENHGAASVLSAKHPRTLEHQTWMLSDTNYDKPQILTGSADVRDQDGYWIVAANDCKHLKIKLAERQAGSTNSQAGN
jgi:hypothetical protein